MAEEELFEVIGGFIVLAMLMGLLVLAVLFLVSLWRCLSQVAPENRAMEPGLVFLNFVPLFNLFWMFYTAIKLADSLQAEAKDRSIDLGEGGRTLGVVTCVMNLLSAIPFIGMLFFLPWLIMWIIYWVKIAGYNSKMKASVRPVQPHPEQPAAIAQSGQA